MADIDIVTSTITEWLYYRYPLYTRNSYIPIFIGRIPYEWDAIKDKQLGIDVEVPQIASSIPTLGCVDPNGTPHNYASFSDKNFNILISTDEQSRIRIQIKGVDSSGTEICNYGQLYMSKALIKNMYNSASFIICGLMTTDNHVVSVYPLGGYIYSFTTSTAIEPTSIKKGAIDWQALKLNHSITATQQSVHLHLQNIITGMKPVNIDDPYSNAGDTPDDPPDGDFDYTSDDVTIPDLPETSVTDSGLVTLFAPDNSQLNALAKYLWSDAFSLDSFKKLFNNPMDCILGLSILPVHLPHGSAKEITVGNIVSTVSCDVCSTQYVKLNCGTFKMSQSAFTGGYLDYSPYTKAYLYLPFIGTQQIDVDEFMDTTMGVEYHIDILTGAMFCYVTRNGKLLLTYAGNCAENVPLSSNDFTNTLSSMLSVATVGAGAVATIATAGASAPALVGAESTALGARTASSLVGAGATGAGAVMNSKPSVQHSGSLGGGAGAMGCLYPYILFVAPRISMPSDQNKYTGFPSNKIVKIGDLSGFNVIEAVNLSVKGAQDIEISEIESILRNGVII